MSKIYTGEWMVASMASLIMNTDDLRSAQAQRVAVNFVVSFRRT